MNHIVATHIEVRSNRDGQPRTFIQGSRVRLQDIYAQAEIFGQTPADIAESLPELTLGEVHAALSYIYDHRDEIVAEMKADEDFVSQLQSNKRTSVLSEKLRRLTGS